MKLQFYWTRSSHPHRRSARRCNGEATVYPLLLNVMPSQYQYFFYPSDHWACLSAGWLPGIKLDFSRVWIGRDNSSCWLGIWSVGRWMDGWTSRRRRSIVHFCDMWQCLLFINEFWVSWENGLLGRFTVRASGLPTSLPVHMMIDVVPMLLLLFTTVRSRDNLLLLLQFSSIVHGDMTTTTTTNTVRQSVGGWVITWG